MAEVHVPQRAPVMRRLLRTTSARIAAIVALLAISSAVFAPFLANDRPFVLVATDIGAFDAARASLVPVTRAWIELARAGETQWLATQPSGSTHTYARALALERGAIVQRLRTLGTYLDQRDTVSLGLVATCESALDAAATSRSFAALESSVREVERALVPEVHDSSTPREPPRDGMVRRVALASVTTFPLFAGLSAIEVACAAGWLALGIAWLAWRSIRARASFVLVVVALALLAWGLLGDTRERGIVSGQSSIKAGIETGDIVVERAWFPPIPMGQAETHMREAYRPPSWLADARATPGSAAERGFEPRDASAPASRYEPAPDSRWRHLLGTDSLGRDLLARLVWGARTSLFVGLASALILTLVGIVLGALAGWLGGTLDFVVSRAIEVVLCFPAFVLVLCAAFFLDRGIVDPVVAVACLIGFLGWASVARLVRAECLRLRELEFVMAARSLGLAEARILWRHVLPNAIQPAIIAFAFAVGAGILTESALSFLGFGVTAPTASWGALVSDSKSPDHAWIWVFPGACIFAVVACANILGEALRDALDPRHER